MCDNIREGGSVLQFRWFVVSQTRSEKERMAAIIAQLTRAKRERESKKTYEANKEVSLTFSLAFYLKISVHV